MTADRIAKAIDRRSRNHKRGQPAAKRHVVRTPVTQEELDDKARWLDGQVQGWTAARAL